MRPRSSDSCGGSTSVRLNVQISAPRLAYTLQISKEEQTNVGYAVSSQTGPHQCTCCARHTHTNRSDDSETREKSASESTAGQPFHSLAGRITSLNDHQLKYDGARTHTRLQITTHECGETSRCVLVQPFQDYITRKSKRICA